LIAMAIDAQRADSLAHVGAIGWHAVSRYVGVDVRLKQREPSESQSTTTLSKSGRMPSRPQQPGEN
jgi:hypothetical protein